MKLTDDQLIDNTKKLGNELEVMEKQLQELYQVKATCTDDKIDRMIEGLQEEHDDMLALVTFFLDEMSRRGMYIETLLYNKRS